MAGRLKPRRRWHWSRLLERLIMRGPTVNGESEPRLRSARDALLRLASSAACHSPIDGRHFKYDSRQKDGEHGKKSPLYIALPKDTVFKHGSFIQDNESGRLGITVRGQMWRKARAVTAMRKGVAIPAKTVDLELRYIVAIHCLRYRRIAPRRAAIAHLRRYTAFASLQMD